MSSSEKKETLRKLVESGKAKGSLSNREIIDTLADVNISAEQLEKLYDKLEANGIEKPIIAHTIMLSQHFYQDFYFIHFLFIYGSYHLAAHREKKKIIFFA